MTAEEYKIFRDQLPSTPGIYRFLSENELLYVGKAKDIRKRVSSYFLQNRLDSSRLRLLVKKVKRIEFTIVETEQDALLLENTYIKNHQPKYNIQLKDDKTYPFIVIKNERFPRIYLTRNFIPDGSEYLGPYTSVSTVKTLLQLIKSIYQLRTCNLNLSEKNISAGKYKVCLEYHIGNCKGPCEALQQEEEYNEMIGQIRNILKGQTASVIQMLKNNMQEHSEQYEFEKANLIKVKLDKLSLYQSKSTIVNPKISNIDVFSLIRDENLAYVNYLKVINGTVIQTKTLELKENIDESSEDLLLFAVNELRTQFSSNSPEIVVPIRIEFPDEQVKVLVPKIGDKKKLLELAEMNALYFKSQRSLLQKPKKDKFIEVLEQLKTDFRLPDLPLHIECFDNSNIQGSNPVASVVVFRNGKPSKKEYRHFNIKTVIGANDFASMEEIVYRRYRRFIEESEPMPNLIIIDGGKGQLSAAMKSIELLGLTGKTSIASIAKKLEEIYFPGDPVPLHINKRSPSLKLIQNIRNEAHRFAITFHRTKRNKGTIKTSLTGIKGVGDETAKALLRHFKSIKKLKESDFSEIEKIVGTSKAQIVTKYLGEEKS